MLRASTLSVIKRQPGYERPSISTKQSSTRKQSNSTRASSVFTNSRPHSAIYRKKEKLKVDPVDKIVELDLSKYSPQKIFNVLFINETDEYSDEVMKKVTEISRDFEDISFIKFITYEEVTALLDNYENTILPPTEKQLLQTIVHHIQVSLQKKNCITPLSLAKLMKLKLIEVMYTSYIKAVTKMQKRRKLAEDLNGLIQECLPSPSKHKIKGGKKVNISRSKVQDQQPTVDYTTIPIETEDDITFDDDINHHIFFYIFHGFNDVEVLSALINTSVQVPAIIKMTAQSAQPPEKQTADFATSNYSDFWNHVLKYFVGPERRLCFENTFLMTFKTTSIDSKQIFEELVDLVRTISDIKLQHLNYIRHLEIFGTKEVYNYFPLECLTVYNNLLQRIPLEATNIPVILDSLLKQVCVAIDQNITFSPNVSQHSFLSGELNYPEKNRCINPCSVKAFLKSKGRSGIEIVPGVKKVSARYKSSFATHENDELTLIRNSYPRYGPLVYDTTVKMLKSIKPMKDFNEFEADCTDIVHKHHRDPSAKTVVQNQDTVLHFLYLFLFSTFEHRTIFPKSVETDLTKHLETYSKFGFINLSKVKVCHTDDQKEERVIVADTLYNPASSEYLWKERLESVVLLQKIFKAQTEYLYWDARYSPETDTFLIQFSDDLDNFGTNTRIYDQSLPTPVCLRDFCRYTTVEQAEWLEKNKPPKYIRKCALKEECQGMKKIIDLHMFPEYRYLIETDPQNETETIDVEREEVTFEQTLEELQNYPPNSRLIKECSKFDRPDKFLVYDFGTKYFQVIGATSTFHSHDDVKLSIHNTRRLDEHPKCTVHLDCKGNSFIIHSSNFYISKNFDFHVTLADGTIITFIFVKSTQAKDSQSMSTVTISDPRDDGLTGESTRASINSKFTKKVHSVGQDYFNTITKSSLLNEEYSGATEIPVKPSEVMLENLKQATILNIPIYKVNSNLTLVKKLKSEIHIPLANIVKRVLHTATEPKTTDPYTKRYLPIDPKSESLTKNTLDVRIALPNGLYISYYPSKCIRGEVEIKQEFLGQNLANEQEEFRLFTRDGCVLIKKIDGSITTLKSNGDTIGHEKLDATSFDVYKWSLNRCHCRNLEDYKKRVSKILKSQNDDATNAAISRRANYRTKRGYALSGDVTTMLKTNKLPYLKTTLLKLDGTRVCEESGKIRVKKIMHTTFQHNFGEEEFYYERGDGFKCTFNRDGEQILEFADGTKIISRALVHDDLVEGYAYISMEYQYEHPVYATLCYKVDDALEVTLNNNVVFRKKLVDASLKIDDDIVTNIDNERVIFEKTCAQCKSKYNCDIYIYPLVAGEIFYTDRFLHASDSYNKHFYCDYRGNCERNDDYITGPINTSNCNHYSSMSYKKLFVVNRNYTGDVYWTSNMVQEKQRVVERDPNSCLSIQQDATNPKIEVYWFKTKVFNHYSNRFFNKSFIGSCYEDLVYSTYCVAKKMIDRENLEKLFEDLANYFVRSGSINSLYCISLKKMIKGVQVIDAMETQRLAKEKACEVHTCECLKKKMSFADKISRWRKECEKYRALIRSPIPCYFKSDFCQVSRRY